MALMTLGSFFKRLLLSCLYKILASVNFLVVANVFSTGLCPLLDKHIGLTARQFNGNPFSNSA